MSFTDAEGLRDGGRRAKTSVDIMEWLWLILAVFLVVEAVMLFRTAFVSAEDARRYLTNGATIVDVRTEREFRRGHVPKALNIPLNELREQTPLQLPNKDLVLLLHCHSGGRSEMAKRRLQKMGYTNVYNLGSLSRAQQIVSSVG